MGARLRTRRWLIIHIVETTEVGEAVFHRLRSAAVTFDQRLRAGLSTDDMAALERLLDHLHRNITDPPDAQSGDRTR